MIDFYKEIGDILGDGGADYAIVPIGDSEKENTARTTVTTVGSGAGDGLVFTYSEARNAWDAPTVFLRNRYKVPLLGFNDSDEEADTPDVAFWTNGDGANDVASSMGVNSRILLSGSTETLISKDGGSSSGQREWNLQKSNVNRLALVCQDDSAGVNCAVKVNTAQPEVNSSYLFTYDGRGGADAADGMTAYIRGINGPKNAQNRTNNASYIAMEALTGLPTIGALDSQAAFSFYSGSLFGGPLGPFLTKQELTAAHALAYEELRIAALRELPTLIPHRRSGGVLVG